jgi:zinc transport system ATP-binding protein
MQPVISVSNLSFAYQEASVLQDISFEIQPGQFIGIIGPNGGGKTTLLKLLLGFLKTNTGKIEIFGKTPITARQHMAYVPQSLRFDKQFPISVMELVMGGRLAHLPWYGCFSRKDKDIACEALEKVGLLHLQNRPFGSLSGGQAQRALIARALASEPRLLLLDEPTASVDAKAETEIYDILKKLQGKMTILMVTHNLEAAIELVEEVICVQHNAFILDPQQVCEHYALGLYHAPLINLKSKSKPNDTHDSLLS